MEKLLKRLKTNLPFYSDIPQLLKLYGEGNPDAVDVFDKLIKTIESDKGKHYHLIRPLVLNGFEPAFNYVKFEPEQRADHHDRGDYFNEYWGYYLDGDFTKHVRIPIQQDPILKYEERYFRVFYDTERKELTRKDTPRVNRLNEIAEEINANIATISLEDFIRLKDEATALIYNKEIR